MPNWPFIAWGVGVLIVTALAVWVLLDSINYQAKLRQDRVNKILEELERKLTEHARKLKNLSKKPDEQRPKPPIPRMLRW